MRYLLGLGGPVGSNIWEGGGVVYGIDPEVILDFKMIDLYWKR